MYKKFIFSNSVVFIIIIILKVYQRGKEVQDVKVVGVRSCDPHITMVSYNAILIIKFFSTGPCVHIV